MKWANSSKIYQHFKRKPHKMVKHTQTILWQIPDKLIECVWPLCGINAQRVKLIYSTKYSVPKFRTSVPSNRKRKTKQIKYYVQSDSKIHKWNSMKLISWIQVNKIKLLHFSIFIFASITCKKNEGSEGSKPKIKSQHQSSVKCSNLEYFYQS